LVELEEKEEAIHEGLEVGLATVDQKACLGSKGREEQQV